MDFNKIFDEFEDLKNELTQTRNLTIRTDNMIQNLHHEIKQLSLLQNDHSKKTFFHNFLIILIVIIIVFFSFYYFFYVKISQQLPVSNNASLATPNKALIGINNNEELEKIKKAEKLFFQIKENLKNKTALEDTMKMYDLLTKGPLGNLAKMLLVDDIAKAKNDIGISFLENGKLSYNKGDLSESEKNLKQARDFITENDNLVAVNFYLGKIYSTQHKYNEGNELLKSVITDFKLNKYTDDALFVLATNFEEINEKELAIQYYRELLKKFSSSAYGLIARNKLFKLSSREKPANSAIPQKTETPQAD